MNTVVGNTFLCILDIDSILQKKVTKSIMILISICVLLVPSSFYCSSINCQILRKINLSQSQTSIVISYHNIFIDLTDPQNISVIERITLSNHQNTTLESITMFFNETYANLIIKEENQALFSYNETTAPNSVSIEFLNQIEINETRDLRLKYNLEKSPILQNNKFQRFYFGYFNTYFTTQKYITVRLSKNSEISTEPDSILPFTERPEISQEGFVDINWNFNNVSSSTQDFIQVIFKPPTKSSIWIFIIGPILGLTCGIGGTTWFMKRKGKKVIKEIGKIFLSDSEKLLLKLILKNNGKISQKDLCDQTGYTKAKVSRNLISLEKQDLITREKWGRNYQVYITDLGKKVIE